MKENTLEVLFYLFDNYPEVDEDVDEDRAAMNAYLQGAGFMPNEINRAFDWLESLADAELLFHSPSSPNAIRIFSPLEQHWLNTECQGYLLYLEQAGVLNAETREQIIDRVVQLEDAEFDLDRLKWVVLMILLNRPPDEVGSFWAEGLSLDNTQAIYH